MLSDGLKLRAAATPSPEMLTESGFDLNAMLSFQWQLTLGGERLDPAEIAELAEAKRPLIRIRDQWVTLDPSILDKLRRPPRTRMPVMQALGAGLSGAADIDGELVDVIVDGPLADLARRVTELGA